MSKKTPPPPPVQATPVEPPAPVAAPASPPINISDPDLVAVVKAALLSLNLVAEPHREGAAAALEKRIIAVHAKLVAAKPSK